VSARTTLPDATPGATGLGVLPASAPQMVRNLRKYQAELEIQNQALRYSQSAAEGASERFPDPVFQRAAGT